MAAGIFGVAQARRRLKPKIIQAAIECERFAGEALALRKCGHHSQGADLEGLAGARATEAMEAAQRLAREEADARNA